MGVTVYRWDDSGAPTLSASNGALIGVLDACLVNGYAGKPAAGWSKAYAGTNKASYRQGAGSNGLHLRVDNGTGNQYPRWRGFETMSDIDTGTGLFPTDAQISGGAYCVTSSTNDGTVRPWLLAADSKRFIFYTGYEDTLANGLVSTSYKPMSFFGDIISYRPLDAYHTLLICCNNNHAMYNYMAYVNRDFDSMFGHYMARGNNQISASVNYSKVTDCRGLSTGTIGTLGAAYPDPVTGGLLLAPIYLMEPTSKLTRGRLPGIWAPLHNLPGKPGDTFSGTAEGGLNGRSFILLDACSGTTRARLAIETSDTWET